DTDPCTDDGCAGTTCTHPTRPRFGGINCRLDGAGTTIGGAAEGDLNTKVGKKLGKLLHGVQVKLAAAERSTVTKKRTKLLRGVTKKINAMLSTVAKAQVKGTISDPVADRLIGDLNLALAGCQDPGLLTP